MTGVEAEWDPDNGKYKIYTRYTKEMSGDDIGVFFSYDTKPGEQIQVQMGVSFVNIENARQTSTVSSKDSNSTKCASMPGINGTIYSPE